MSLRNLALLLAPAVLLGAAEKTTAPAVPAAPSQNLTGDAFATGFSGESSRVRQYGAGVTWKGWTDSTVVTIGGDVLRIVSDNSVRTLDGGIFATVGVKAFPGWWVDVGGHGRFDDSDHTVASMLTAGIAGGGARWGLVADGFATDLRGSDGITRKLHQATVAGSYLAWTGAPGHALWLGLDETVIRGQTLIDPEDSWQFSHGGRADLYWGANSLGVDGWVGKRVNAVLHRGAVIQNVSDERHWGTGLTVNHWWSYTLSSAVRFSHEHMTDGVYGTDFNADTLVLITSWSF